MTTWRQLRLILLMVCILSLTACTLFKTRAINTPRVEVFKNQWITLPTPQMLDLDFTATQILSATYSIKGKAESYITEVQVEVARNKIVLVAAAGWGGSIFSLLYDGKTIESSSLPMPHADMGVKQSLIDFIFTYAPTNVLKTMLADSHITLEVEPNRRLFYIGTQLVMKIDYQNQQDLYSVVHLYNYQYHYQIKIKTLL
ncbi:DUF3261 domain-containing protein [Fastidiosibacter lacustris]|uniref:DUF3261 domain-containing protein n=1 Tax=Fastidiosibacter lacustris TaxID=2056695 RepID=UPI000E347CD8|nr:DUF3261 domain-containing protein [Fastidiosibacter lacustris]